MVDTFAGQEFGGRFKEAKAKAIHVATGVIVVAFNHVWFASVPVSPVDEKCAKAIPLRTLVAISCTSAGN